MAEWLKAHAWKACVPQGTVGSNPTLSASIIPLQTLKALLCRHRRDGGPCSKIIRQFRITLCVQATYDDYIILNLEP
jgi:hypothetical protein